MPSAIVTGSDSGIGRATAVELARRGYDVGITWHSDERGAQETAEEVRETGRRAEVRRLDLSVPARGGALVDDLASAFGGLDVLVNNSGTGTQTPALELELEQWQHVIDVDLTGAFASAQAAARRMVDQGRGGRIINVTSVHEHIPLFGSAPYSAAKGGLGMLTKVLALELARHRITVNSVAPGAIATPMIGAEDVDPHTIDSPGIPARRPGDAREVAALIGHLCSEDAAYITGSSLVIDGGLMLMAAQQDRQAP